MPVAEWKIRLSDVDHFPGIIHVAVDLQEPSPVLNNNIKSWIFISDGSVRYGDDPQNYSEDIDEQDVIETTEKDTFNSHRQMQYDASSLGWSSREWSKEDLLETIDEEEEDETLASAS
ncbi:uncharacterized protein [Haliotis asinina]|uniref:uncharacterized protein n=1 Tax=Haliotis asinina TaxID=109174 RepID=UPI003531C983